MTCSVRSQSTSVGELARRQPGPRGLRLPIVYNTSAYDSPDSLSLLEGIVDVYMPDLKMWTEERARR